METNHADIEFTKFALCLHIAK